jgi:hypothetical protein
VAQELRSRDTVRKRNLLAIFANPPVFIPVWKGSFGEGAARHYDALIDCSCPDCPWPDRPILAIVSYPTIQEAKENWSRLSESERKHVAAREDFVQQWEAGRLGSPEQLPELQGSDLTIS